MTKPHVHAELIKAWADGANIEYFNSYTQDWVYRSNHTWDTKGQYRIKPVPKKKVTRWLWCYQTSYGWLISNHYLSEEEVIIHFDEYQYKFKKLEWSAMEFDE